MTLFRKVFQNQAQPATAEDAIDEEALREAFNAPEKSDTLLILDPFEHGLKAVEDEESAEDAADAELQALTDYAEETDESAPGPVILDDEAHADADTFDLIAEEYDDEDGAAPMDEDINAFVGRALAADDAKANEETPNELVDAPELDAEPQDAAASDVPVFEDVLHGEGDAAEAEAETEDMSLGGGVSTTPEDAIEAFALSAPADTPDSGHDGGQDDEHDEKTVQDTATDVAAFAQQQMAALSEPEAAPSPAEEEPIAPAPAVDLSNATELAAVPAPAAGRSGRRAGRAKTRLLGFNRSPEDSADPFGAPQEATAAPETNKFPVGWMVIVDGPGMGHSFSIFAGASTIGRGEDQGIRLDFGDNSISRNNHAAVAYDDEENKFYIGHGGKSNIIRRNARPVLSTEELHHADLIRIGETTLRFVALCGSDFQWSQSGGHHNAGV